MAWRLRGVALRLSATFLALTLAVAVPVTLIFDHFARNMIKEKVEKLLEKSEQSSVLYSEELTHSFLSVRVAALSMVTLTSLLAAGCGAWIAFRWRLRMLNILQRGRTQAYLVHPSTTPPASCTAGQQQASRTDELAEIEDQLIHTLERLSRSQWLLDSVEDIVILADRNGMIRHGNAAMGTTCACCPIPRCESIHISHIVGPPIWQRIHNGLNQGRPGTFEEQVSIAGRSFPALISYRPQDAQAVIKITDLTEYRQLKEHVEKLQALSTLGEMSTEFAHEIKNNILPVKLLCELAPLDHNDRNSMLRSLAHIHNLVNDFMDFGAGNSGGSQVLDFSQALTSWSEVLRTSARHRGVTLYVEAPSTQVNIPSGLRVVYTNLVRNAIQASATGGYVKVQAQLDSNGTLELSIADNGEGIPEQIRERIFEPFATTRAEGTGLGLALVERYVHEAGGFITCDSHPQCGTTFTIIWPHMGEASSAARPCSDALSANHAAPPSRDSSRQRWG